MINLLPENNNSAFKGDNLLFEFLNNNYKKTYHSTFSRFTFTLRNKIIYWN